jgi:hypothetical protein
VTFPKLKIDVLMAMSIVERNAVSSIDEWHTAQLAADRPPCEIH